MSCTESPPAYLTLKFAKLWIDLLFALIVRQLMLFTIMFGLWNVNSTNSFFGHLRLTQTLKALAFSVANESEHMTGRAFEALTFAAAMSGCPVEAMEHSDASFRVYDAGHHDDFNVMMMPHVARSYAMLAGHHLDDVIRVNLKGVFNMGRNFSLKVNVPLSFKLK